MKNKGFSLIEIVVAVAIIGILSGIVGLQLRGYIAKAKDAKAVATLNSFRVAAQLYQTENETALVDVADLNPYNEAKVIEGLKKLETYLDNNAKEIMAKPEMVIGGSKTAADADVKYGGKVRLTFKNPSGTSDGFYIWLEPTDGTGDFDIKGHKWIEY